MSLGYVTDMSEQLICLKKYGLVSSFPLKTETGSEHEGIVSAQRKGCLGVLLRQTAKMRHSRRQHRLFHSGKNDISYIQREYFCSPVS